MHHRKNVEKLRGRLKSLGRNYTPEREELLKVIYSMEGVYSLEDLYQKAFKKGVIYAKSTVYRTVDIYLHAGFIKEAEQVGTRKRYKTDRRAFIKKKSK
jgi:Fe2+ or Zn2+ uptake regulation protein